MNTPEKAAAPVSELIILVEAQASKMLEVALVASALAGNRERERLTQLAARRTAPVPSHC